MEYNFRDIEKKWQEWWKENKIYRISNQFPKPKYYVLDMFPYPSGTGLHVGHPLGYIASDIYARFKRLKGYNVLHPMGYDAFGLPAEQYAIDHGIHPATSTEANIKNFRSQLDKIGFSFDWDREVNTSKPDFYKWTQWIFLQLFDCFYNRKSNKAEKISVLIAAFEKEGNKNHPIPDSKFEARLDPGMSDFSADKWKSFDEKTQQDILMEYRLAYCGIGEVNWCEALGTVLANDEVINGVSERGGYPVVKKKLRQWYMRITEYADRLLEGLTKVDFSEAMKEMQSNWIGKSSGAEIDFKVRRPPLAPPKGENTTPKYQTAQPSLYSITKMLSEEKRNNPTHEEQLMWQLLRANKTGFHIRRQHIIGSYIVDFACLDRLTTIEIDGSYHNNPEIEFYDRERTAFLQANGFTELRFTNEEVTRDAEAVVKRITAELSKRESISQKTESSKVSPLGGDLEGALKLRVYTTRPDTIFGVDFMVIAPEHELVEKITSDEQRKDVEEYIYYVNSRSERERMAEKKITGVFTGAYAINPFDGRAIPIWISEYVLAGYGTGAIMAVPCGDQRDFLFAKHFNIPITNIIGNHYNGEEADPTKDAVLENSDFINGMVMKDAIDVVIKKIEEMGIGVRKVNYKMRDAAFSRQRYWGEPFPIVWKNGIAYPLDEKELPLELPHVDSYKPGPEGEGPLANIPEWIHKKVKLAKQSESSQVSPSGGDLEGALETNTMPGYAGSSWYFLRYMDPYNEKEFCDRKASDYWNQVDLYIGGTEHAVGHLLYSRMWTKFLYDINLIGHDEPYKRLVNQGMIQGSSRIIFVIDFIGYKADFMDDRHEAGNEVRLHTSLIAVSYDLIEDYIGGGDVSVSDLFKRLSAYSVTLRGLDLEYKFTTASAVGRHVNISLVDGIVLNIDEFKNERREFTDVEFVYDNTKGFTCKPEVEKMSKRYFNVVNPDDLCNKYGADTYRMYEMFLGPVEMSKPWDTKGIEGVHRFLKKLWRLFYKESGSSQVSPSGGDLEGALWTNDKATEAELKVLHRTIKKIEEDTERFSFNTGVSAFMIAVNDLTDLKCHKKEILEPLLILLAPYAPHITEELYHQLNSSQVSPQGGDLEGALSILNAPFPELEEKYLKESSKEYPISINGKMRTTIDMALGIPENEVEKIVLANAVVQKWLEGKPPKKIIYKEGKMVNVVV